MGTRRSLGLRRVQEGGADEVGVGPWPGDVAGRPALRPRAARARRPAQRRRPLPVLAPRGRRRRPRRAPARLPRRDRELAARLQHRLGRAHRQRVPRPRGAHRRAAGGGTGAARWSPTATSTCATTTTSTSFAAWAAQRVAAGRRRRQPARARCRWRRPGCRGPACCCSARRARGCPSRPGSAASTRRVGRAVRLDPLDQRRRRGRRRHARLDPPARRAATRSDPACVDPYGGVRREACASQVPPPYVAGTEVVAGWRRS